MKYRSILGVNTHLCVVDTDNDVIGFSSRSLAHEGCCHFDAGCSIARAEGTNTTFDGPSSTTNYFTNATLLHFERVGRMIDGLLNGGRVVDGSNGISRTLRIGVCQFNK